MEFLQNRIKQLNQRIIDNCMELREDSRLELERKYNWAKNEPSGITGYFINKEGNITFKI